MNDEKKCKKTTPTARQQEKEWHAEHGHSNIKGNQDYKAGRKERAGDDQDERDGARVEARVDGVQHWR